LWLETEELWDGCDKVLKPTQGEIDLLSRWATDFKKCQSRPAADSDYSQTEANLPVRFAGLSSHELIKSYFRTEVTAKKEIRKAAIFSLAAGTFSIVFCVVLLGWSRSLDSDLVGKLLLTFVSTTWIVASMGFVYVKSAAWLAAVLPSNSLFRFNSAKRQITGVLHKNFFGVYDDNTLVCFRWTILKVDTAGECIGIRPPDSNQLFLLHISFFRTTADWLAAKQIVSSYLSSTGGTPTVPD
jgi:hypothetical protein